MATLLPFLPTLTQAQPPEIAQVLDAARAQTGVPRHHDGSYLRLDCPGGVVLFAWRPAGHRRVFRQPAPAR